MSIPQIIGYAEIPQSKGHRQPTGGKRGPGRFYLHGGERATFTRQALAQLRPGQALVVEFDDRATLEQYRLLFHNLERPAMRVRTKARGTRLYLSLREDAQQLALL